VLNVCTRKRLITRPDTPVFEWSWEKFIQRLQTFLERGGSGLGVDNDYGFLVTDRTHDDQLRRLMRKLRAFNYVPSMIPGSPRRKLLVTKMLDDPTPRDSRQSYWIQMADLIAYALARKLFQRPSLNPYHFEIYFDILDPILLKEASHYDPQGIVVWP
jgi:Protein of unknown function (DUF3800)